MALRQILVMISRSGQCLDKQKVVVLGVNLLLQFNSRDCNQGGTSVRRPLAERLLSKPARRLCGTVVSCGHHEHHYANNHYRRVSSTLRRGRLLLQA